MTYNPYRKYCLSWWKHWFNLPKDIFAFIKMLCDYSPLLWYGRDWDYLFAFRLMRFHFKRLRKHMEEHGILSHNEDIIAELANVDVLLRNVVDEDPDDEWIHHWNRWDAWLKEPKKCAKQKEHFSSIRSSRKREEKIGAFFGSL